MTHDELLDRMRYYTDNKAAVIVYEHGTCVAASLREGTTKSLVEIVEPIVKQFDVEKGGEGSPLGDFELLNMDDGNTVILLSEPRGSDVLLDALHGLSARAARTRDAREKKIARLFDPRAT